MRSVVFENGDIRFKRQPKPKRKSGEALIRVSLAGICNTDMEISRGYMDYSGILGHEFTGRVVECDDEKLLNKRVVGEINSGCGKCEYCLTGLERHCPHRDVLGIVDRPGCMADYLVLPEQNLHIIPDSVSNRQAVFTEPLAAACEISEQVHIRPDQKVLVIGDGKLAQLIARFLHAMHLDVLVAGKHQFKMDLLNKNGIHTIEASELSDQKFDFVVEASGSAQGFLSALQNTKPRGTIILKSTVAQGSEINLAPLVINEINVVGSRCGLFQPALRILQNGRVNTEDLITAIFPAEKSEEAFQTAADRSALKVIIDFGD